MPDIITENEIQTIIGNFNENITEYEIIDMEKYKGWSSVYLFLLVSADENYILKAKTTEQIAGYDNEVKISTALIHNNIEARRPILTKGGSIFHEQYGYYWCVMTYIPGAPSHVNEYNDITIKTLAEHIDQYVLASTTNDSLMKLDIEEYSIQDSQGVLDKLMSEKNYLESEKILDLGNIDALYSNLSQGYPKLLGNIQIKSIIHNDINPRNILIDHKTKQVISLIDWDHVRYGNPLKDVSDAVAIFYDNLPLEKASEYKKLFLSSIKSKWFTDIDVKTIDYAFLYYFTVAKWRAVLFYLELLKRYDNKYGEEERFKSEIRQNYTHWLNVVTSTHI